LVSEDGDPLNHVQHPKPLVHCHALQKLALAPLLKIIQPITRNQSQEPPPTRLDNNVNLFSSMKSGPVQAKADRISSSKKGSETITTSLLTTSQLVRDYLGSGLRMNSSESIQKLFGFVAADGTRLTCWSWTSSPYKGSQYFQT